MTAKALSAIEQIELQERVEYWVQQCIVKDALITRLKSSLEAIYNNVPADDLACHIADEALLWLERNKENA